MTDRSLSSTEVRYCPAEIEEADYVSLQAIDLEYPQLCDILNRNGHASWTVCPECRVDDFTHVEGCRLG